MSGYLARLALSTRNPGGSIRPVLRPLFSAPGHAETLGHGRVADGYLSSDESELAEASPREGIEPPGPSYVPLNPKAADARRATRIAAAEPRETAGASEDPLPDRTETVQTSYPAPEQVGERRSEAGNAERTPRQPRRHSESLIPAEPFQPIATQPEPGPARAKRDANTLGAIRPQLPDGDPGRRQVRSREAGPTEIEIHIGRIEVTAVPQTPQPPPTKPPAKSSSLDAYLNRRDPRVL
jgi:hypothetical protein